VPLVLSPVSPELPVETAQRAGLDAIARRWHVGRVVFGDLWLAEIRDARRAALGDWLAAHDATLHLPLWHVPHDELLGRLFATGPRVRVSASRIEGVTPGMAYDRALVSRLPPEVDAMGEDGSMHTEVLAEDLRPAR
jgi:diphthamide synthase (EF-2-diphthine--ammonia ligase)